MLLAASKVAHHDCIASKIARSQLTATQRKYWALVQIGALEFVTNVLNRKKSKPHRSRHRCPPVNCAENYLRSAGPRPSVQLVVEVKTTSASFGNSTISYR